MTVFFRPRGDLCKAPFPRSDLDRELYEFLSDRTGLHITYDHDNPVDYEDWMEPAKMLEAALRAGYETLVLPSVPLRRAVSNPLARVDGKACRDILIGFSQLSDWSETKYFDLGWPTASGDKAHHYAELSCFEDLAGRKLALADMPGEVQPRGPAFDAHADIASTDLLTAMERFSGKTCILKQTFPAKSWSLEEIAVPERLDERTAYRLLRDKMEYHLAHQEGAKACLLFQEKVRMTNETRFFVVNHQVVVGAACIESDTPQVNAQQDHFPARSEEVRNSGNITEQPDKMRRMTVYAEMCAERIAQEAPDMPHYVVDIALDEQGIPLVIELNPIPKAGLYGAATQHLFDAIIEASEAEPHHEPAQWSQGDFEGLPEQDPQPVDLRPLMSALSTYDEDEDYIDFDEDEGAPHVPMSPARSIPIIERGPRPH